MSNNPRKILLVTLYAPIGNYGNALQRYALQEVFRSYGFEADNLLCPIADLNVLQSISKKMKTVLLRASKMILAVLGSKKYRGKFTRRMNFRSKDPVRKKLFMDFHDQFITGKIHSTYKEVLKSPSSRWQEYDYISTGSDQVWNLELTFTFESLKFFYLEFSERSKRINYAPSFGQNELKPGEIKAHKEGLMGFDMLSCREESGCRIIRELTGRDAELVLDPTLLLTADDWRKISRRPQYDVPEHYALIYLLGNDSLPEEYVKKIAGDMPVIEIHNPNNEFYCLTGPCEFLWLFDHADCVMTDSFHGTAFSVMFRKRFFTFRKETKKANRRFDRINTLLSCIGLTSRIFDPESESYDDAINYDDVYEKLNIRRESSMKYLRECLKIKG